MNFTQKFYDEIFLKGLTNSYEQHLISRQEEFLQYISNKDDIENFYVMLLSIHSEWLSDAYEQMKLYRDGDFINTATGSDLDNIGERCGIQRKQASYAYTDLVFTLTKTQEADYTIPAGVVVRNKRGNSYKTDTSAVIPVGESSVTVTAYSTVPGVRGKVDKNTLTMIETSSNKITLTGVKVTNPSSSSGGEDKQTDTDYREYLKNWTSIQQKGNEWAYKYYLNQYDGLDGYGLLPCWDGAGTVKVIVDRSSNTDPDFLNNLYNDLLSNCCLFDDDVTVVDAVKKNIDVSIVVDVDIDQLNPFSRTEKDEISKRTVSAVKLFIDGGYRSDGTYYTGLSIGEDFIPHKLGVFLDMEVPELKDVQFNYPLEYVALSDEEIASSGSVSVVVL